MKLLSIQLYNFRQFYGKTPLITLAAGDKRKITVIHGNNGAGKTAILNAFTWVLYEKFTAAFASEEQLVNKRAIAEAKLGSAVECWVEVAFEHGGTQYRAKRTCRAYSMDEGGARTSKSEIGLMVAGEDGRWMISPQPAEDVIGRILPESLHQYFFFDGERIEQIVRTNKKSEIAEATKVLLGVEVLNRSIRHLGEARRTLENELEAIGDPETQDLLKKRNNLREDLNRIVQREDEIEKELGNHNQRKQDVEQRLRELDAAKLLQQQRDMLQNQKQVDLDKLKQSKNNLKLAISNRGYTVLLSDAIARFRQLVDELRERGELPADIKQQFVKDLLSRGYCICGTALKDGEPPHDHVSAYLEKAGLADVEETVIRMGAQVETIDKQVPEFWKIVDQEQKNISRLKHSLSQVETKLDDISAKLKSDPREDIQELEGRRGEIEQKIRELTLEQGDNRRQRTDLENQIKELSRQIDKLRMSEERQELAKRRIKATEEAISRLKEVRQNLDLVFRTDLERRVQNIFDEISVTSYTPKLSEKYELTLVETVGGQETQVAPSTGENQILSLSFIGSIIDRVREWSEDKSGMLMGPDTGTFPIVMDSPFGALDEIYRRQVARTIPTLANQLIALVSKTQWRGEVAEEMDEAIGKMYVLAYQSPKPNCERDSVSLWGETYDLVRQSPNKFEWTEVVEVR